MFWGGLGGIVGRLLGRCLAHVSEVLGRVFKRCLDSLREGFQRLKTYTKPMKDYTNLLNVEHTKRCKMRLLLEL